MKLQVAFGCLVVGFAAILAPQSHAAGAPTALQVLDPDNDGTVDLAEAKAAATKLFDKLDRDHDGTLDQRELKGRLSAKDFKAADPDNDGTLDKDEYLALVEKDFNAANPDNDGTLDAKELGSKSGVRPAAAIEVARSTGIRATSETRRLVREQRR